MEFIKKIGKEINVFGLILIIFVALMGYRYFTHNELTTLEIDQVVEKVEAKDSFVVLLGSDEDNVTLGYKDLCTTYLSKNKHDKIYYVDVTSQKDPAKFVQKTFTTDDGTTPCMIVVEDGKVIKQKDELSYYRIVELFK